jgi:hypothetical protein
MVVGESNGEKKPRKQKDEKRMSGGRNDQR